VEVQVAQGQRKTLTVALAGTPNVGKSVFLHQISGMEVVVSNYPGTTVEITEATVRHDDLEVKILDLPGIYSLSAVSDDEIVAIRAIVERRPDVIVNIADASNLERSLYLTLQLIELGFPTVVALNMMDEAKKRGMSPSPEKLSRMLGVPVVPTVAITGENVSKVFDEAIRLARERRAGRRQRMSRDIERAVAELADCIRKNIREIPHGISPETVAIRILEGDGLLIEEIERTPGGGRVLKKADALAMRITKIRGEPPALAIARERHSLAALICRRVTEFGPVKRSVTEKLDHVLTSPRTGLPIMVAVFLLMILWLVYFGGWLEQFLVGSWEAYVSPHLSRIFSGMGSVGQVLDTGLNWSIIGVLAVAIPYVLPFYFLLGLLEDVGYLPRAAFLMDSLMHRIGLHGRAVIPMLGGFGCNVPAVMATRAFVSRRERLIASVLITMIPCSARTSVILGTVGSYLGLPYALAIYGVVIFLIFLAGVFLNRALAGKVEGMIMEIPPLRRPIPGPTAVKMWMRTKHFLIVAVPILLVAGFTIGVLQATEVMDRLVSPLSPLTSGLLGLPPVVIIPLVFGFLRKEGALVLLVSVAKTSNLLEFMSPLQLFVYALVVTIYMPCAATFALLGREIGWKTAILTTISTFLLAIAIGSAFYHINPLGL
jgi:ferrous iron transport protein B